MGYHVDVGEIDSMAGRLAGAGDEVEGGAAAPPAPDVGAITGPVAATLRVLVASVAGVSEGMHAAAQAARTSRSVYRETDDEAASLFRRSPLTERP